MPPVPVSAVSVAPVPVAPVSVTAVSAVVAAVVSATDAAVVSAGAGVVASLLLSSEPHAAVAIVSSRLAEISEYFLERLSMLVLPLLTVVVRCRMAVVSGWNAAG